MSVLDYKCDVSSRSPALISLQEWTVCKLKETFLHSLGRFWRRYFITAAEMKLEQRGYQEYILPLFLLFNHPGVNRASFHRLLTKYAILPQTQSKKLERSVREIYESS